MSESEPIFIGLVETKHSLINDKKLEKWWGSRNFNWAEAKAVEGSGGLICLWHKESFVDMSVKSGRRWISVEGYLIDRAFRCSFLVIYAPNDHGRKRDLWNELQSWKEHVREPILAVGDFNEVLFPE